MKRLPKISKEVANKIWLDRKNDRTFTLTKDQVQYIGQSGEELSELEVDRIVERLEEVQFNFPSPKGRKKWGEAGGQIDAALPEVLHSELKEHATASELTDLGFWRWLSNVANDGFFWKFIMWRLPESDNFANWGITSQSAIMEVYFFRAWFRGHKMWDQSLEDPYYYARLGSSDVWRSHILRKEYGRDKEFVKAFLDTIYDSNGKTIIKTEELRDQLIPAIRAWTSNAVFTHLTYEENKELLRFLREQRLHN